MERLEEKIIEVLQKDREAGAELLLEKYSGLVWQVCARRLSDVEDIKECVNSTFAEFCMNYEKFDPEKGSLRNYLWTLADWKALDCLKKNDTRYKAEENVRNQIAEEERLKGYEWEDSDQGEQWIENLTEAMKSLEPLDAEILRKKYYDDMTFKEIAAQLGLPYETVKKRGQRSLKKLMKILLIGLLMAVLVGCAFAIYQYFQFSEGAGINWDMENPLYEMKEEGPSVVVNGVKITVKEASYQGGILTLKYTGEPESMISFAEEEWMNEQIPAVIFQYYMKYTLPEGSDDGPSSNIELSDVTIHQVSYSWTPEEEGDRISVHITGNEDGKVDMSQIYGLYGCEVPEELDAVSHALEFDLVLEKVETQNGKIESLGEIRKFEGGGFLVQDGKTIAKGALVPLYPFDVDADYSISARLTGSVTGYREEEVITLVGEDGTEYPMTNCIGTQTLNREAREMYFEGAKAGEYTLKIPYLMVGDMEEMEPVSMKLPEKEGDFLELNHTFTLKDGSQIKLTRVSYTTVERITVDVGADGIPVENAHIHPEFVFEYEWISGEKNPYLHGGLLCVEYQYKDQKGFEGPEKMQGLVSVNNSSVSLTCVGDLEWLGTEATVWIDNAEYVLDESYKIPITVK